MLTTQFYDAAGAPGFRNAGFGDLGAIQSTAGTAALQNYLKSIGKYAGTVTGVMNDATMAVIFNALIESAATIVKIPLLPANIRGGITTVVNTLKSADSKIRNATWGQATLASVIRNWININALVRLIPNVGPGAADAMATARDAVYNAVASQAGIIQQAMAIFTAPTQPAPGTVTSDTTAQLMFLPGMQFQVSPQGSAPGTAPAVPSGTIWARSMKFPGRIRVAIPKLVGGLGSIGVMSDGVFGNCIFGDCGLGATAMFVEQAPVTTPPTGGTEVTEKELEKRTGQTPIYKKPLFWVAVAGGVVVVGGGSYWFIRRRKRSV